MDLEKALKKLIYRDPFYGLFLLNIDKQYSTEIDTAAVARNGINCRLLINKDFWDSLLDDQQIFLLKHEVGHIMFKHFFIMSDCSNHEVANIAEDAEINQYLDNQIPDCITPQKLQLPERLGSREYYKRLMNNESPFVKIKSVSISIDEQSGKQIDDHSKWDSSKNGNKSDGFGNLSESEKELISNQIDHITKNTVEQTIKQRGTIPACFKNYIDELFKQKPAIFNWKKYFRRLIGTNISIDLKKTRKKESIRFPDSSAIKYRKKSKILVTVDTSGSVNNSEICDFFSEINHITKSNVEVDICECDAQVDRVYRYNGKWDGSISGRGGRLCASLYRNI